MDIVRNFIQSNNIDIDSISNMSSAYVYEMREINEIVSKYGIYRSSDVTAISVADIVGIFSLPVNYNKQNIVSNLDNYFKDTGEKIKTYSNRANSMLDYNKDNIISGLYETNKREPMEVILFDNGQALIADNGLHRYHVLRILYLSEFAYCTSEEEKETLRKKYVVPVKAKEIDYVKTYSNYMFNLIKPGIVLKPEYSDKLETTGRVVIPTGRGDAILTDEQLIDVLGQNIDKINTNSLTFQKWYNEIPSFQSYINSNFPMLGLSKTKLGEAR